MIALEWFEYLIYGAVGLAFIAPIVLIVLVILDWQKDRLW